MPDNPFKNRRILVVDDEERMVRFIRLNLEHDGFQVIEAYRGVQALDRLRIACHGTENTMPHLMECVHAYATLGEIIQVMKGVFGTYEEPTWI